MAAGPGVAAAWFSWGCWTTGVSLRWLANVYGWHWRTALPLSAGLELTAFLVFFRTVAAHEHGDEDSRRPLDTWVVIVIAATCTFLVALLANAVGAVQVAVAGVSPAFLAGFDERFLHLETWGFLVPFVWGFSARWLPVFLGLRPTRSRLLLAKPSRPQFGRNGRALAFVTCGSASKLFREGTVDKTLWLKAAAALSFFMAACQAVISISPAAAEYFQAPPSLLNDRVRLLVIGGAAALIPVLFGLYALSGAGVIRRLPLLRTALVGIGSLFLLRGLFIILTVLVAFGVLHGRVFLAGAASHLVFLSAGIAFLAGAILNWKVLAAR